ncbi:hypothetical protein ACSNN7_04495 [Micromonospora sp. URMC 105]|uniref:hypothetical protein n=1 Tax=Micromonospora sp. URMC 105 TaxID=3423413 RepID=UPI003F1BD71F
MSSDHELHVSGLDRRCAGCRTWWSRLTPYRRWHVEWVTSRQARVSMAAVPEAGA